LGILLIFLGMLLIICTVASLVSLSSYDQGPIKYRLSRAMPVTTVWAIVISVIYGLVAIVSLMGSYSSYLDTRAYYDNLISQYKGAITLYEDKAVSLDMEKAVSHGLTDMRYQGYQNKMGDFIMDLRKSITNYNSTIIKKRLLKKNFFYGWYIIPPDPDMRLIDIMSK
jgi:hypothetical protein